MIYSAHRSETKISTLPSSSLCLFCCTPLPLSLYTSVQTTGPRSAHQLFWGRKTRVIILRKAWEHGAVEFDGATIKLLPDLSRATLQRRAMLRPLLDLARRQDCTYRWGYPLAVSFRKTNASFMLRTPADLPALFAFLGVEPIQVPNWLTILPRTSGRPGPSAQQNFQLPRCLRPRRRGQSPSIEGARES